VGDWTARIWNEDLKTPLLSTRYHSSYLNGGTWSPSRPGVFFTIRQDGVLDVWDLFYKHNAPTLQVRAATCTAMQGAGQQPGGTVCVATMLLLADVLHCAQVSCSPHQPSYRGCLQTLLVAHADCAPLLTPHDTLPLPLQVQVSDRELTSFTIQESGAMCAAGTSDGAVSVLQLSPGLSEMAQNEKQGINALLERETLREKNLEKALKEAKVKAKKDAARKEEGLGGAVGEGELAALEEEFFKMTA
jgi:hypothetical protein